MGSLATTGTILHDISPGPQPSVFSVIVSSSLTWSALGGGEPNLQLSGLHILTINGLPLTCCPPQDTSQL